jgi:hypothetical protein
MKFWPSTCAPRWRRTVRLMKMFGGLAFMLNGNMCCGIVRDELMVRVGPDQYAGAVTQPHAREMDFTGGPMRGMIMVAPAWCRIYVRLTCKMNSCA